MFQERKSIETALHSLETEIEVGFGEITLSTDGAIIAALDKRNFSVGYI